MNRRSFITGMAGILASATAPWVVTKAGVLMPIKKLIVPQDDILDLDDVLIPYARTLTIEHLRAARSLVKNRNMLPYGQFSQCMREFHFAALDSQDSFVKKLDQLIALAK